MSIWNPKVPTAWWNVPRWQVGANHVTVDLTHRSRCLGVVQERDLTVGCSYLVLRPTKDDTALYNGTKKQLNCRSTKPRIGAGEAEETTATGDSHFLVDLWEVLHH